MQNEATKDILFNDVAILKSNLGENYLATIAKNPHSSGNCTSYTEMNLEEESIALKS